MHSRLARTSLLSLCASLSIAACGHAADGRPAPTVPTPVRPVPVPAPVAPNAPMTIASLEQASQAALADAARRSGLAVGALQLVSAERVTWPDGSLGCPEPGMLYTQALVPGYRIRIRAGATTLDYHAGLRGAPRLCPAGQAQPPVARDSRI